MILNGISVRFKCMHCGHIGKGWVNSSQIKYVIADADYGEAGLSVSVMCSKCKRLTEDEIRIANEVRVIS